MQSEQKIFYYADISTDRRHVFCFWMTGTPRGNEMRFREALEWCAAQFGPPDESLGGLDTSRRWLFSIERYTVIFRHSADAMFFKLRWT